MTIKGPISFPMKVSHSRMGKFNWLKLTEIYVQWKQSRMPHHKSSNTVSFHSTNTNRNISVNIHKTYECGCFACLEWLQGQNLKVLTRSKIHAAVWPKINFQIVWRLHQKLIFLLRRLTGIPGAWSERPFHLQTIVGQFQRLNCSTRFCSSNEQFPAAARTSQVTKTYPSISSKRTAATTLMTISRWEEWINLVDIQQRGPCLSQCSWYDCSLQQQTVKPLLPIKNYICLPLCTQVFWSLVFNYVSFQMNKNVHTIHVVLVFNYINHTVLSSQIAKWQWQTAILTFLKSGCRLNI